MGSSSEFGAFLDPVADKVRLFIFSYSFRISNLYVKVENL